MKAIQIILIACLILFGTAGVALVTWQFFENRQLAQTNEELKQSLQVTEEAVAAVSQEKDQISNSLQALEKKEQELHERLASLEATAKNAEETRPRPYRVRAFLGKDNVGQAWIVPHNVAWDQNTGRYTFEPLLLIDESARDYFTVYHTNVVERDYYTSEYYNEGYDYLAYPYYYGGGRPWRTNQPPVNPRPPGQPLSSSTEMAQQPDARARVFAPPMSIIDSRPQVVGRPATSPINVRVFAP